MGKKTSIVWLLIHPIHYHSYLLEKVNEQMDVDSTAIYLYDKLAKFPWKDNKVSVESKFLTNREDRKWLVKKMFDKKAIFIVVGYYNKYSFSSLVIRSLFNLPVYLFSDTPAKKVSKKRDAFYKLLFKLCDKYLVTGNIGVQRIIEMGQAPEKAVNFPFATNIDFFVPDDTKKVQKSKKIYFSSGRIVFSHKGYDVAIKAFSILKSKGLDNFKYVIAGVGPDQELLEEMIKEYGLQDNVELLGWLEPTELINYYQSSHYMLHPSRVDPFPNAVLESMACGLPVIGSNMAGSVVDRVDEGKNGWIFTSDNVEELLQKLEESYQVDESAYKLMSHEARSTAEKWPVEYNISVLNKLIS